MRDISKTSVALGTKDRQIVGRVVEKLGLNFSAALRMIVREWAEVNSDRFSLTEKGAAVLTETHPDNSPPTSG